MRNPYCSAEYRRVIAFFRPLAAILWPFLLPQWMLWRVARFIGDHSVAARCDEAFFSLMKPWRVLAAFVSAWSGSRSLKKLLIASPVLLIAFAGFSVYFMNANLTRGRALAGYHMGAAKALNEEDYKKADFLFSKLISHPSYKDNDELLFQAMVAASANNNEPRVLGLQSKLVEERSYEPAMRWSVERYLNMQQLAAQETTKYIRMAREQLKKGAANEQLNYWRRILVRLLLSNNDVNAAIDALEGSEELDPSLRVIKSQIYSMKGDNDSAKRELLGLLEFLEMYDAEANKFLAERVECLAALSGMTRNLAESRGYLDRAFTVVKRQQKMSIESEEYEQWLTHINLRMFQLLLQENSSQARLDAFSYLEQVATLKNPPYKLGSVLNGAIEPSSGYAMLSGQIREVVAKRGGSAAHIVMALDSWSAGDVETTLLHAKIAVKMNPSAFTVLRYTATSGVVGSDPNKLDLHLFKGSNRSSSQRAIDFLNLIAEISEGQEVAILFDKCFVDASSGDWRKLLARLEGIEGSLHGSELVRALQMRTEAYEKLGEIDASREARRQALEAARVLQREKMSEKHG